MPNWTINNVHFSGPADVVTKIYEAFNTDKPFQTLYPCPQELLDTVSGFLGAGSEAQAELEARQARNREVYGHKDWYDWCVANWGTKWDATTVDITYPLCQRPLYPGEQTFSVRFDTAWSPPDNFLAYLSRSYPDLLIEGDYSQEEDCHDTSYEYTVLDGEWTDTGVEYMEHDDPPEEDDCSTDPSFRAVTGSATKLPLP